MCITSGPDRVEHRQDEHGVVSLAGWLVISTRLGFGRGLGQTDIQVGRRDSELNPGY